MRVLPFWIVNIYFGLLSSHVLFSLDSCGVNIRKEITMPYKVVKRSGARPWKIVNKNTGKVVGSSKSKKDAMISKSKREKSHK